jgi:hypothetical protein
MLFIGHFCVFPVVAAIPSGKIPSLVDCKLAWDRVPKRYGIKGIGLSGFRIPVEIHRPAVR